MSAEGVTGRMWESAQSSTAVQPLICGHCGLIVNRLQRREGESIWMCSVCARLTQAGSDAE